MTGRPFLLLAGEYHATMPAVFANERWQHTMTARRLVDNGDGTIRRDNRPGERLRGLIYYASVDNDDVRRHNLRLISSMKLPCWPDPDWLLTLDDRHLVMNMCRKAGLTTDPVQIRRMSDEPFDLPRPFVLKTGNMHQGQGKHLIGHDDALPEWGGLATAEPFYEGVSCRVLCISEDDGSAHAAWGIRYDNPDTWIKNAAGAEQSLWADAPGDLYGHAARVHAHFGLQISGIDYVVDAKTGTPHFLEYNQFPGLGMNEAIEEAARAVFARRMADVERAAG